jgi:hypothetical protein
MSVKVTWACILIPHTNHCSSAIVSAALVLLAQYTLCLSFPVSRPSLPPQTSSDHFSSAVIKFVRSRDTKKGPESEPLISEQDPAPHPPDVHASAFDFALARFSIIVDVAIFAALPFAPTSLVFMLFMGLTSLGSALGPAVNSVALDIYSRRFRKNEPVESGKLFGAMSVVQCLL